MGDRLDLHVVVVGRSVHALHGYGGLERHLYDLVRYHLYDRIRITLVTRPPDTPSGRDAERWSAVLHHPRFSLRYVPYRSLPFAGGRGTTIVDRSTSYPAFGRRAGREAAAIVATGDADVVYGVGASVVGYAAARRRGATAPLVMNPQGMEEFGGADGSYGGWAMKGLGYLPLRRVVRAAAGGADAVIATDEAMAPVVRRHLPQTADRLRIIPNGLDVEDGDRLLDADASRQCRVRAGAEGGPLLVSVGRLEANKGFGDLIDALAILRTSVPWRWALVGEGPQRTSLESRLRAAGLGARVILPGRVSDRALHAWLGAADLFVHPTRYEGSSLVTLEAMLHRKPVVATRAGGLPDKVMPGRTGWLAPARAPDVLARVLEEAFSARDAWPSFGAAGRTLLERRFDWRVIQPQFRQLYEELLRR